MCLTTRSSQATTQLPQPTFKILFLVHVRGLNGGGNPPSSITPERVKVLSSVQFPV